MQKVLGFFWQLFEEMRLYYLPNIRQIFARKPIKSGVKQYKTQLAES